MPEATASDADTPDGPFFKRDREAAREAGRKGGLERQRLARLKKEDPDAYLRETFESERAELTKSLVDAALGRGKWHDLPLEKQLDALKRALEYAVGRPVARKEAEPEPEEDTTGLTIE